MAKQKRIIMQEALDKAFVDKVQVVLFKSANDKEMYDNGYYDGAYDAIVSLVKGLGYYVFVSDTGKHSVH